MASAKNGDAVAQFMVGCHLDSSKKDLKSAFKWYLKAADQGHAKSQYNHSLMYLNGDGTKVNMSEASKWMHASAASGDVNAMGSLASANWDGNRFIIRKDFKKGEFYIRKAAELGSSVAQYDLCCAFEEGTFGFEQSLPEAAAWVLQSANQGFAAAQAKMRYLMKRCGGGRSARSKVLSVHSLISQRCTLKEPESQRMPRTRFSCTIWSLLEVTSEQPVWRATDSVPW